MLMALLFGQILISPDGGVGIYTRQINCGANVSCTRAGTTMTLASSGGGGGGAPTTALYWVGAADGTLLAEQNLGALATGLVINTAGVPTAYAGATCAANRYATQTSASGALTCSQVATSQLSGTITNAQLASSYSGVGTCTNQFARVLNANAAPTCATVTSADVSLTTTGCTNQFVTAISASGVGTCTTDTLASAQHANQGTTTTVLHGNAAGNPSWASVSLTADVAGTLAQANGGTGAGALTCTSGERLTSNGTVYSCSALPVTTAYSTIQDEGGALTQRSTVNFTGAGVTCVDSGGITVCTVAGGGGGGGNWGNFSVTFGTDPVSRYESDPVVVAASWVGASSEVIVRPKCYVPVGANTAENCLAAQIACQVIAVSAGVSFTAQCMSPFTASGSYTISYTGS